MVKIDRAGVPAPVPADGPGIGADPADTPRRRDATGTRRDILAVAAAEFASHGLAGARVDEIAARTRTTKRMIYYHFTSKEALYAAVIEAAYGAIRDMEAGLDLSGPAPGAMRRLVEATFDHHAAHPGFVRLVAAENVNGGRAMAAAPAIAARNATVLGVIGGLLARGVAEGAFRRGVDPLDLHMLISGFCFYRVSNRHTLGAIFGVDPAAPARAAAQRAMAVEAVLRYLAA